MQLLFVFFGYDLVFPLKVLTRPFVKFIERIQTLKNENRIYMQMKEKQYQ